MKAGFTLRLAWREARASLRRLFLYGGAIVLGVTALVAVHSFRNDVRRAFDEQAQSLLGADVRIGSGRALPDTLLAVLDSLTASGRGAARATRLVSMVLDTRSGGLRLLQVHAVEPGYPFYGNVVTDPGSDWNRLHREPAAYVDPAVLVQLDAEVGDTLGIGESRFVLAGTVTGLPTDVGFQAAVGPRVFIAHGRLDDTGLIGFGSIARHQAFLLLPDRAERDTFFERYRSLLSENEVNYTTAEIQAQELTFAVDFLARYMGLVGLAALLLGGVSIASAVHVYVRERLVSVAVLRCIGADQGRVFRAYLIQAGALGALGSLAGVGLGVAVQHALPVVLAGVIPVEVVPRVTIAPLIAGGLVGAWVSILFALSPLLEIRGVPPLLALRHDVEPPNANRLLRAAVWVLLVVSVVGIALLEAPSVGEGAVFTAALVVVGAVIWLTATAVIRGTRKHLPSRASYATRQGLSNLFRPGNQTLAVTLALGFGVFIVGTIGLVESNLVQEFDLEGGGSRANMLLFDVQASQSESIRSMLEDSRAASVAEVPLVPARLIRVNGRSGEELLALPADRQPAGWALRREYRHTYRASLSETEEIVGGRWWGEEASRESLPQISVEADLAESLRVGLGDRITWDVGGIEVETLITSLRIVDWAQFAPNFFVVFEPGALDEAPQTRLLFARIETESERADFQGALVSAHPNVSVMDLSRLQETIEGILARVNHAVRFLGGFCTLAGILVLAGALATTRYQRMREGALLKTLGAKRATVLRVLLAEYAALGLLGVVTGLVLAVIASWLLLTRGFETSFALYPMRLVGVGATVTGITVLVGLASSRAVLRSRPLVVLRSIEG